MYPSARGQLQAETTMAANAKFHRRLANKVTFGWIKPFSKKEEERGKLLGRIRTQIHSGRVRIGVLSLKGGVGKTTTAVALGATLASIRRDRVVAVDANPDRGNLKDRSMGQEHGTVRDLINNAPHLETAADVESFMVEDPSRLSILPSEQDPERGEAFSASDYETVTEVLRRFFAVEIIDCGTGITHPAMEAVLKNVDQIVIVSSAAFDGADSALFVYDWLNQRGYGHLANNATIAMNRITEKSPAEESVLREVFEKHFKNVRTLPFDEKLAGGNPFNLEWINKGTRAAYEEFAACVADNFSRA